MTQVTDTVSLLNDIRELYRTDPEQAHTKVEQLLVQRLEGLSKQKARSVLRKLIDAVDPDDGKRLASVDTQVATRVFGLILGKKVSPDDLSSTELLERLAQSLNTIFDSLNQLISVINATLSAGESAGEQTIRQFIGFHLDGEDQTKPLEDYLGQINQAFLTTQEAFKKAALKKVQQILQAIDPKAVENERSGSGLKIGPLRKAENYDILKEKIGRIQRWYESGRFMEDFLREFEKNCQSFDSR